MYVHFLSPRRKCTRILNPYLKEGIDVGDQVVTILESNCHSQHRTRLEAAGINVDEAVKRDQLKVMASEESYLKDGIFVVERMFRMLEEAIIGAEQSEFKHIRTLGDMEWVLHGCPGTEDLMPYEARVNQLTPHHDCTLLCAYDINKFSGRVIADVLATHSHVLLEWADLRKSIFCRSSCFPKQAGLSESDSHLSRIDCN